LEPYPPHAEIDIIILQEFIRQGGVRFRTLRALKGLTFSYFPPEPLLISRHGSKGRYVCARDYVTGNGPLCLDIAGRFLDEPLESAVLGQLRITAHGEKVLLRMEAEARDGRLKHFKNRQDITRLERDLARWQSLLTSCVDEETGRVDKEKETLYWDRIREIQKQIEELRSRQSLPTGPELPDFQMVREFMSGLPNNWSSFPRALRNRFLKCLIDRVEIRGGKEIEATIFWKAGFQQEVMIQRRPCREKPWTDAEDDALKTVYPASPIDDVMAAIPGRSWHAITNRSQRLHLHRDTRRRPSPKRRPWTSEEDGRLKIGYDNGRPARDIAADLRRSPYAVQARAAKLRLTRNESFKWQARIDNKPMSLQGSSSPRKTLEGSDVVVYQLMDALHLMRKEHNQ
jgi:hypothetical protein